MASRKEVSDLAKAIGAGAVHGNVVACICHVLAEHNPAFNEEHFTTIINAEIVKCRNAKVWGDTVKWT